ncbi:hypothetical protein ACZ11_05140 [Lysinibacillus xylanilyticus]|uniref:Thioesterase domain-containing protein n=1 Tax=Lysinibacillus xylanilyticus TaxID=582475 RepID=A0A0K9FBW7_9BACI|nr:thioesterase domain-containing protein [Lysinibacillus xylanilyticus]KMY31606.1 hypothetical protein ACZ11_05140 [Lysinibacillus xylanilyticus]
METIKLVCFPYAGASAMVYNNWRKSLNSRIQLVPIELAGRGKRYTDNHYQDFNEMVEDVYSIVKDQIDERSPYALFGHSMGSWLAYELTYKIMSEERHPPMHVFFSARRAPHLTKDELDMNGLSMENLKETIFKLGGTPKEIYENDEMMNAFLPIIYSDFKVMGTFDYVDREEKLPCAISVMGGKEDKEISISDLLQWKEHSQFGCKIYRLPGGHFFQNENVEQVTTIINDRLIGQTQSLFN